MNDQELPVSDLLAARRVADAGPDFWNDLEAQLATEPAPVGDASTRVPADGAKTDAETPEITLIESGLLVTAEVDDQRPAPAKRRRRVGVAVLAAAAAIVAVVIGLSVVGGDTDRAPVITEITPTTTTAPTDQDTQFDLSAAVRSIEVGPEIYALESSPDAVWVRSLAALYRIDRRSDSVVARIDMPVENESGTPQYVPYIAVADSGVWAVAADGTINRIDPETNAIDATIDIASGFGADWEDSERFIETLAAGDDAVWVSTACGYAGLVQVPACGSDRLLRIDPASDIVVAEIDTPTHSDLVLDGDAVWLLDTSDVLHRVDPARNEIVSSIQLDPSIERNLVVDQGTAWLVGEFSVRRLDLTTGELSAQIRLFDPWDEQRIGGITTSGGDLYVAEPTQATPDVYRVDADTNVVTELDLGLGSQFGSSLAADAERLWFKGPGAREVSYIPLSDVANAASPSADGDESPEVPLDAPPPSPTPTVASLSQDVNAAACASNQSAAPVTADASLMPPVPARWSAGQLTGELTMTVIGGEELPAAFDHPWFPFEAISAEGQFYGVRFTVMNNANQWIRITDQVSPVLYLTDGEESWARVDYTRDYEDVSGPWAISRGDEQPSSFTEVGVESTTWIVFDVPVGTDPTGLVWRMWANSSWNTTAGATLSRDGDERICFSLG